MTEENASMDEAGTNQDIHARGSLVFETRWLAVNTRLVELCQKHGIRVWKEPWRTVLPHIAWAWCADLRSMEPKNDTKDKTHGTD